MQTDGIESVYNFRAGNSTLNFDFLSTLPQSLEESKGRFEQKSRERKFFREILHSNDPQEETYLFLRGKNIVGLTTLENTSSVKVNEATLPLF